MKNRVNISKLIREKYRENTLSADEFNEIIDSVLNEGLSYWQGKVDTKNLEENPNQGEQIFYHAHGAQGSRSERPDELGYGENVKNTSKAIPHNLAEQGQSAGKEYTLQVPDIFSMITNSEMKVGDSDRNLIGKIVKNIQPGKGFWRLRVRAINEFVQENNKKVVSDVRDIRSAISSLIMLNVLKKLAFFTAQPGKLFEYVFAPIIGTQAKVVGSTDTSIIDLTKESKGEIWNYSLKFFTGEDSSFVVKGSAANLREVVVQRDRPVTYILASAIKEGTKSRIEFAELLISTEHYHFPKSEGWVVKYVYDNGQLLVRPGACGILVIKKEEYENMKTSGQADNLDVDIQRRTRGGSYGEPQERRVRGVIFVKNPKTLNTQDSSPYANFLEDMVDNLEKSVGELKKVSSEPENLKKLLAFSKSSGLSKPAQAVQDEFNKYLSDVIKSLVTQQNHEYFSKKPSDIFLSLRTQNDEQKLNTFNKIISDGEARIAQIRNALQQSVKVNEAKEQTQDTEQQTKVNFNISLRGSWPLIPEKEILDLGDPNQYNKQQLMMATELADNIKNTFDAFQSLNTNLIKYFATSKDVTRAAGESDEQFASNKQKAESEVDNAGTQAIQDAVTIQNNVSEFQKKEKA